MLCPIENFSDETKRIVNIIQGYDNLPYRYAIEFRFHSMSDDGVDVIFEYDNREDVQDETLIMVGTLPLCFYTCSSAALNAYYKEWETHCRRWEESQIPKRLENQIRIKRKELDSLIHEYEGLTKCQKQV